MIARIKEHTTKTTSIIQSANLNGAIGSMPAKPKIRSARNKAKTMTAIVNAAMQSPFCTADILKVCDRE